MIKEFFMTVAILLVFMLTIFVHSWIFNTEGIRDACANIVAITQMAIPSFAVSTYEPIMREPMENKSNSIYPELPQIDYLDFVYAQ